MKDDLIVFTAKVFSSSLLVIIGYFQLLWITQTNQSSGTALYFSVGAFAGILASKIKLQGHIKIKEIIILTIMLLIALTIIGIFFKITDTTLFAYLGLIAGIPIYVCTKKAFQGLKRTNE